MDSIVKSLHYIGNYQPDYPRHRIIQTGLREMGVAVDETRVDLMLPNRWLKLAAVLRDVPKDKVLLFGEASNYLSPVMLIAKQQRRPVVFDPFISLCDMYEDRETGLRRKFLPKLGKLVDHLNNWTASAVLLDTDQTRNYFVEHLGLHPEKAHVAYVGAEPRLFHPRPYRNPGDKVKVLFYGTFIPLHGIEVILRAAKLLLPYRPDISIQIVGNGQTRSSMQALAERLGLENVDMNSTGVGYTDLPSLIATADIALGIFADRPKTRRVIPNKLYQCAAMGVPVITADTPALREGFTPDEIVGVPSGNPQALAEAIVKLTDNPSMRRRIGAAGSHAVRDRFSPSAIATRVLQACQNALAT